MNPLTLFDFKKSTTDTISHQQVQIVFSINDWLNELTDDDTRVIEIGFEDIDRFINFTLSSIAITIEQQLGTIKTISKDILVNNIIHLIIDTIELVMINYYSTVNVVDADQHINDDMYRLVNIFRRFITLHSDIVIDQLQETICQYKTQQLTNTEYNVLSLSRTHKVIKVTFFH